MQRIVLAVVLSSVACAGGQRGADEPDDGSYEVARGGFGAHAAEVERCWVNARRDTSGLEAATVRVSFSVATDGSTSEISASSDESGFLAACVRELVKHSSFPRVNEPTRVEGFPLVFP